MPPSQTYIGFDYIRQTETYLRNTLESTLTNVSYAVASSLNNKPSQNTSQSNAAKTVLVAISNKQGKQQVRIQYFFDE